jgi:hypothetical protein
MNKTLPKFILSLILLIIGSVIYPQQNPSGLKWKSIDTGTYEIIFPEEITPLGQRVANLMVHYEKYNYSSIKAKPRHIPIVLINQYAEPNGFVSPAPFYSHWFTTPSSFDSVEWFKGLAIHEGRHMVQMNKLTEGFGKSVWQVLLGDMGSALFSGIYVPVWFMEGDAVVMETALTKGGRGRTPYFDIWQRGLELSDAPRYSYYKSYLGAYDALVPYADHYRLGYILCSYIRKHYGKEIWDSVLSKTGRFIIAPSFNWSLELETGKSIRELYTAALNEYQALWIKQQNSLKIINAEILTPGKKKIWESLPSFNFSLNFDYPYLPNLSFSAEVNTSPWESFLFPSIADDGKLTAIRFSRDKNLSFIKFDENNKIKNIKHLPFEVASTFLMNERIFTTGGGFALWREGVPDPRWGYRSYSNLKLLNMNTGKSKIITESKKFIASTISNDGKTVAGIEHGPDLKYFLTMIDIETNEEILKDEINDMGYLFDPAISPDKKEIALSALSDNGYAILLYNIETKKITTLIEYTKNEQLRSPVYSGKFIMYGSDYSGIDNIYAIDLNSKKRYQVTSRSIGAYFPSVSGETLFFNDYSVTGYKVASMKIDHQLWIPIEKIERGAINYIEPVAQQELTNDNGSVDVIPDFEYEVKNYHPILHIFNPFAWVWFPSFSSDNTTFSFILLSKDVLHTTDMMLSNFHNFNENTNFVEASIIYGGKYPVIAISGGYGGREVFLEKESTKNKFEYLTWNETKYSFEISLPLNFSQGIHSTRLDSGVETGYIRIYEKNRFDYTVNNGMNANGELNYMKYYLTFTHLVQNAINSVTPNFGQLLNVSYTHTPYSGDYRGNLFSADLILYLPGITDTQGFKIEGSYEHLNYQSYAFSQVFLFPRGYNSIRHEHLLKGSIDYAFPIFSFSANISKVVYFKRLNGKLFFDYGAGNDSDLDAIKQRRDFVYYRSAGYEITAEQNWLSNKYLAIELGLRYSRCFDADEDAAINKDKNRYDLVVRTPI